jgi:hypothetical protein
MSSLDKKEPDENSTAADVVALLNYYFELGDATAEELLEEWLERYPVPWTRLAIIESLYQGRYKAISVNQILEVWHRRHQVLQHFNYDFECLVCSNLSGNSGSTSPISLGSDAEEVAIAPETPDVEDKEAIPPIIGQFTPDTDRSEFYLRLQAIAQKAREKREREAAAPVSDVQPTTEITPTKEDGITRDR